jgi:hypothetical protein
VYACGPWKIASTGVSAAVSRHSGLARDVAAQEAAGRVVHQRQMAGAGRSAGTGPHQRGERCSRINACSAWGSLSSKWRGRDTP